MPRWVVWFFAGCTGQTGASETGEAPALAEDGTAGSPEPGHSESDTGDTSED